jgi:transcriptional regulator with XRE-family HTH domain
MISPKEIRAARVYLDWSQDDLAERSGLAVSTIRNIEAGTNVPSGKSAQALERSFAEYIDFLPHGGFQPRQETVKIYKGRTGFIDFLWNVHDTVKAVGGEICVSNVDEKDFFFWLGKEPAQEYKDAMALLEKNFYFKVIIKEGDDYFAAGKYAEYRWIAAEEFSNVPFYVYGDKLAIILFEKEVSVYVLDNKNIADAYRVQFNTLWNRSKKPTIMGRLE